MTKRELIKKINTEQRRESLTEYFLLITTILLFSAIIFYKYFFGKYYYIFQGTDTIRATFPAYHVLAQYFEDGWSWWSFKMGLGASQLSRPTALADPFNYILFLSVDKLPSMIIVAVVSRITCAGTFFYAYLKHFKLSKYAKFLASIAYAFCGYIMVTGRDYGFATICVYIPLVLIGMEKAFRKQKYLFLTVSLFLVAIYFNIMFYMTVFLVIGYFVLRFFSESQRNVKKFLRLFFGFLFSGISAILLSAFWVIPVAYLTSQSPRIGGSTGVALSSLNKTALYTAISRLFNVDALGNSVGNNVYWGYANQYMQLAVYTSILAIFMICFLLASREKVWKRRITFVLCVMAVCLIFNFFPYLLNGFSTITYRWTFTINFFVAVCLAWGLDALFKKSEVNYIKLIFFALITIVVFAFANNSLLLGSNYEDTQKLEILIKTSSLAILCVFICMLILIVLYRKKILNEKVCKILIALFLFVELYSNYYSWVNQAQVYTDSSGESQIGYFDTSNDLIKEIKKYDTEFYRINKDFDSVYRKDGLPSNNDALVQGYYGLKHYSSLNPLGYIEFLQNMGIYVINPLEKVDEKNVKPEEIKSASLNFINGVGNRYDLASFLGVKYFLTQQTEGVVLPDNYVYKGSSKNINYYINMDYNPLVFVVNNVIKQSDFDKLSNEEKDKIIYQAIVINDFEKEDYSNVNSLLNIDETIANITKRNRDNLAIHDFGEDSVEGKIKVESKGYFVTTIPYDKGWEIFIDGKKADSKILNNGLLGCVIQEGEHEFQIKYFPYLMKECIVISGLTVILLMVIYYNKAKIKKKSDFVLIKMEKGVMKIVDKIKKINNILIKKSTVFFGISAILNVVVLLTVYNSNIHKTNFNEIQKETLWNSSLDYEVIEDAESLDIDNLYLNTPKRVISNSTRNLPLNCDLGVIYYHIFDKNNITIEIVGRDSNLNPHKWIREYTALAGWGEYYEIMQ